MDKKFALISLILWFGISLSGCKKDETPSEQLPPTTTIGANTMGFKLNGQICTTNSLGNIHGGNNALGDSIYLSLFGSCTNASVKLFIGADPKVGNYLFLNHPKDAVYTVQFEQNWASIWLNSSRDVEDYYITEPFKNPGSITILRNDGTGIISGTFEFKAINHRSGDTIIITEGRFDIDMVKLWEYEQAHWGLI